MLSTLYKTIARIANKKASLNYQGGFNCVKFTEISYYTFAGATVSGEPLP